MPNVRIREYGNNILTWITAFYEIKKFDQIKSIFSMKSAYIFRSSSLDSNNNNNNN